MAAVTRDRAAGKRVGFVAVTFDLLRVGDVRKIQAAAGQADRLIVAVTDEGTPGVIKSADRAELVDSLRGVDYVIVCPAARVGTLAALVLPDVRP